MTRKLSQMIVATGFVALLAVPAQGFWLDAFCTHCKQGAKANERWPSPYLCPDRVHAHAPFDAMVRNGWRRQNLLGAHHFSTDCTKLTQAGELKVQWIMTQAPQEFRRVFVERSLDSSMTDQRIATAQDFATKVAGNTMVPQVASTHILSEGRPAAVVDYVSTQFRENMPVPALPASTFGGSE